MSVRTIQLTVGKYAIGRAVTWSYPDDDGKLYDLPTYDLLMEGTDDTSMPQSWRFEVFRFGVQGRSGHATRVVGLADQQTHQIKAWLPHYTVHSASSTEIGAWQVYDSFLIHDGPDNPLDTVVPYASIGCVEICNGPNGFVDFNDKIVSLSGSTKPTRAEKLKEIGSSGNLVITYMQSIRPALNVFVP